MLDTWKDIQRHAGEMIAAPIAIDGIPGPQTAGAVAEALAIDMPGHAFTATARWKVIQKALRITIDGIPGPQTRGAVARAMMSADPTDREAKPAGDPYGLARTYLGVREIPGKKHNPLIVRWSRAVLSWVSDDETAWCSAFVNAMARETGRETSDSLAARSWLNVGEKIELEDARPGDVVILWRGKRNGWQGHVAFLEHYHKGRELLYLLGGNQRNEVNITAYPVDRLLGIRRLRNVDGPQPHQLG